jgi:hypothetical protein
LVHAANRHFNPDRPELRSIGDAASLQLTMEPSPLVPWNVGAPDERSLARDMIEIHGAEAATVARAKARAAALAAQPVQAKSWIKVLGIIQRDRTDKATSPAG